MDVASESDFGAFLPSLTSITIPRSHSNPVEEDIKVDSNPLSLTHLLASVVKLLPGVVVFPGVAAAGDAGPAFGLNGLDRRPRRGGLCEGGRERERFYCVELDGNAHNDVKKGERSKYESRGKFGGWQLRLLGR